MRRTGREDWSEQGSASRRISRSFNRCATSFSRTYADALCVRTALFPGVTALLDALDAAGLPWGIVTNKATRLTLPLLDALNLRQRPGCIVCGDTTARAKPYPDPLFAAADMLAMPPTACVYVGDAERTWKRETQRAWPPWWRVTGIFGRTKSRSSGLPTDILHHRSNCCPGCRRTEPRRLIGQRFRFSAAGNSSRHRSIRATVRRASR